MAQKKATYKVYNGSNFDEIMLKTLASQVGLKDGRNLESIIENMKHSMTDGGDGIYIKLPSGLIIQGSWITQQTSGGRSANFPVAFPARTISMVMNRWYSSAYPQGGFATLTDVSNTGFSFYGDGYPARYYYIAIGV